ncbi:RNA-directed DNA polymerase, eukaryota, reverse transcriptase zinc-binding domain protein [Tanacetum coccineum]|uniref:RNA-directed DNA polymerase, eukaryota, reverse transcriptase zinc-binding domain protein n=1 Tax=Tanacetum coccineum TaxID=301880 RepID=A0ABQ5GIZ3_9ASTR
MRDPESKNPNSVPPPRGSDDVIKPNHFTRSSSTDGKLAPKYTFSISKPAFSSKRGFQKGNYLGRNLKNELDNSEFEDDVGEDMEDRDEDGEVRDDCIDDKKSSEDVGELGDDGVEILNIVDQAKVKEGMVSDVSQDNFNTNVDNEIPIPFNENVILNPGGKGVSEVSNEGSSVKGNGGKGNGAWPSLNEVNRKDRGQNVVGNRIRDADMFNSASGMRPKSFISTMQGMSYNGNNKLSKIPVRVNGKGNKVVDMDPLLEEGSTDKAKITRKRSKPDKHGHGNGRARKKPGESYQGPAVAPTAVLLDQFKLSFIRSVEGMNFVLENGPWLVEGKPLFVQKWEAGLCMEKPEPTKVPLWVKILNVPLEAWNVHGISRITSRIGNPIIMDIITTSMCDRAYRRASFARVLIEVDATQELADSVEICYSSMGKSMELKVKYAWRPPLCIYCRVFGHDFKGCKSRDLTNEEKAKKNKEKVQNMPKGVDNISKVNDEWQEVRRPNRNGASTNSNYGQQSFGYGIGNSRGGYNNRGRGGRSGRGGFYQRTSMDGANRNFVPVKNVQRVDEVHMMDEKGGDNLKDKGKSVANASKGNGKKSNNDNVVNVKNSFKVLSDEAIEIGGDEWVLMKGKIDLACDLGMTIGVSEKSRWSKDLFQYYDEKCKAKAETNIVEALKWRISKLNKDISVGHTNISTVANDGAKKQCVGIMKKEGITRNQAFLKVYDEIYRGELLKINGWRLEKQKAEVELFFYTKSELTEEIKDTWTDEMVAQYETLVGKKVDDMIRESFDEGVVECIEEEVAEDTLGSAEFMTKNEVSNVVEVNGVEMQGIIKTHIWKKSVNKICNEEFRDWRWVSNFVDSNKGCRIVVGWDSLLFDTQLLSQSDQGMHFFVKRLCDSKEMYVSFVYGENYAVDRRRLWNDLWEFSSTAGSFPDCVDDLGLEDVKPTGLFFTWVQKRRDPSCGVLKKLDRIMGNGCFLEDYPTAFANFLSFGPSNHSLAVLVLPKVSRNWNIPVQGYKMFVLVKMLKFLKKHMRDLNRENGNVCEKSKMLKEELSRIQEALSKDPSNANLREEELLYADAYKKAVVDEELLLKQKSKTQWLKEEDFNTSYFHKTVKGRVIRNRIDVIYDDEGKAVEGNEMANLFVDHFKEFFGTCDTIFPIEDFFKSAWKVVGSDFCSAIREFFSSGKLLGECNASIISLVPKVANPKNVINFRPISCCNVFYKTISKIITNRLKNVLNGLVGENQSAFIPERKISDNILLTQEFMRGYNWNKWTGSSRCAFKIDIQKAYDTVNWDFLKFILKFFGFHDVMINWIMVCLTTASFSVCINGVAHGFFKAGRGLMQGDPISPYLFTLVMEVLNLMVKRHVKAEGRFKYHWGCKELKITNLCFADDLLMLCHGDLYSASVLKRGLDEFCLASGLHPSMTKSEAFFGNVFERVIHDIKLVMPFKEGMLPIKYLGVPMVSRKLTGKDCKVLIEVIKKRVGDWRNKYLSFADKLFKDFLWARGNSIRGMASVAWKDVCRSIWDSEVYRGFSWCWKTLLDLRDKIRRFVQIWPIEWDDRFDDVIRVPVPTLVSDVSDKAIWVDKKGKEKVFSVREVWKAIRIDGPKRLVFGATVYGIWQERNGRCFMENFRDVYVLFKNVVDMVRMKIMGLNMKVTSNVLEAASIWNLYINKGAYYRRMVDEIRKNCNDMDLMVQMDGWEGSVVLLDGCEVSAFCFELAYGDGSGGSDWSRDSRMIQSLLVSCS